jgi:hypothetical protein
MIKFSIALLALLISVFVAASTKEASTVVYCQYIYYPAECVVRTGIVLLPQPVAREGVRSGTPTNGGSPVDRSGRR